MTVTVLDDTFTGGAGNLTAHTPDSGGSWSTSFGGGVGGDSTVLLGDGTLTNGTGSPTFAFHIHSANCTGDDETCTVETVYDSAISSRIGPGLRADGSGNGYWVLFNGDGGGQIYRFNAGSSSPIGSDFTFDPTGSPTVGIRVSGTGATVTVEALVAGSVVRTVNDTSGSRIQTPGRTFLAIYNQVDTSNGFRADRILTTNVDPPPSGSITLTKPIANQIVQRTRGTSAGSVNVTGTFSGTPTTIEARVVEAGTSTPLSGLDWYTAVASPSGASFSFDIAGVPAGVDQYEVQVRHSNDTAVNDTGEPFWVGDLIAWWGQSNARYPFELFGSNTLTPNDALRFLGLGLGNEATWTEPDPASQDGPIKMGNAIIAATGYAVGMISSAVGGTAIDKWVPGGDQYIPAIAMITNYGGGKLGAILYVQGEADVGNLDTADYLEALGDVFDVGARDDLNDADLPVIVVTLGRQAAADDEDMELIRAAQAAYCASDTVRNLRVERWDLSTGDDLHLDAAGHRNMGDRTARATLRAWGYFSTYRGPRIVSVTQLSPTVLDVTLALDYGTDFTAGTGSWRVTTGGSPVSVSSAVRQSPTVVRLTMASPCPAATVGYAWGGDTGPTGALVDNSPLALPLEWNQGVAAQAPSNRRATAAIVQLLGG